MVGAQHTQAAHEHGHLGRGQGQEIGAIDERFFCAWIDGAPLKLRKPSVVGSSGAKEWVSVCSCVASVRPGRNGIETLCRIGRCRLDRCIATQDDEIGYRHFLSVVCDALNVVLIASRAVSALASSAGSFTIQSRWGASRMRAPLAPPLRSEPRRSRPMPRLS
jgi:hypothetical protein